MDPSRELTQNVDFEPLGRGISLADILELETPPFRFKDDAFRQIKYIEDYIRRADLTPTSSVRSVAIESHYVDRDFIFDYSVFFSRNLQPPKSHCRRVHFFAAEHDAVKAKLREIASILHRNEPNAEECYRQACEEFSRECYLGFTVVRPLPACPVGRTVLHLLPREKPKDDAFREMTCTRNYDVHLSGVELTIRGLAFQQQDLAVSRCATVALWCALQKIGDREVIASSTPADITSLASKHRLPYGRSMPSEGLAVDQMCLAIESLGLSPDLARVESLSHGRSLVYSATLSQMPAILIMEEAVENGEWHAVTVTGVKLNANHVPCPTGGTEAAGDDLSGDVIALYVHDDRIGPYRRADIDHSNSSRFLLTIKKESHVPNGNSEDWIVRYVLVPLYPKIRLSLTDLRTRTLMWLIPEIQRVVSGVGNIKLRKLPAVQFKQWIERGHSYTQRVLREQLLGEDQAIEFSQTLVLPRYVAVIRFSSQSFGNFDVLMDTTSARPNYNWIAVVGRRGEGKEAALRHAIAEYIADRCDCLDRYYR